MNGLRAFGENPKLSLKKMSSEYLKLKHIGYCWAKLPPDNQDVTFEDYVNYAKFQLCSHNHILMKDPVWEDYREEEILVEYYALLFQKNPKQAEDFLKEVNGITASDYDWILEQAEDEEKQLGDGEEVSFKPEELGD